MLYEKFARLRKRKNKKHFNMNLKSLFSAQTFVTVIAAMIVYDLFVKSWAGGLFTSKYDNTGNFEGKVNNYIGDNAHKVGGKIVEMDGETYLHYNGKSYKLPQAA